MLAVEREPGPERPAPLRLEEARHELREGREVGLEPGLAGGHGEGDRQVRFPHAGWPEEHDVLLAPDEVQARQGLEARAVHRGREREVEVLQRLHRREVAHAEGGLEPPGLPGGRLFPEEGGEGIEERALPPLGLRQDGREHGERPWEPEAGEGLGHLVEQLRAHREPSPTVSYTVRSRRSTSCVSHASVGGRTGRGAQARHPSPPCQGSSNFPQVWASKIPQPSPV